MFLVFAAVKVTVKFGFVFCANGRLKIIIAVGDKVFDVYSILEVSEVSIFICNFPSVNYCNKRQYAMLRRTLLIRLRCTAHIAMQLTLILECRKSVG